MLEVELPDGATMVNPELFKVVPSVPKVMLPASDKSKVIA